MVIPLAFGTAPIVVIADNPPTTMSPLPKSEIELIVLILVADTKVGCTAKSPLPNNVVEFIVLILVADIKVSCLLAANPEYCEFVALSPVFVPLVFPIITN